MFSAVLLIPLVILALRWANWSRMREQRLINVFLFSVLVVLLFWSLRIPVMDGVSWHVSGITFLTLMWGWSFALLGGSLAVIVQTLALQEPLINMPSMILLHVLLPATLTQVVLGLTRAYLPKHFFIYTFVNAFFCGALVALVVAFGGALNLFLSDMASWKMLSEQYLIYVPLMLFPEAFYNGIVMTVLISLRPQWVWSFKDEEYLQGR